MEAGQPAPPTKVCPHCATQAQTSDKKCPNCGRKYKRSEPRRLFELIDTTGGVGVVGLALLVVLVIALVSVATVPDDDKAIVVGGAFTVLGTIVGAFFGVKAGSAGREQAEEARDASQMEVVELAAAHADGATAQGALDRAEQRYERERPP